MKFQDDISNMNTYIRTYIRTSRNQYAPPLFQSWGHNKPTKSDKFCLLVLKILSGNEILTSIKGRNSVANLRNLTLYNPNLDIINVNVYTKFG